jgi:glycerophosphoryl diester phosphodiesterase
MMDEYRAAGVPASDVFAQSFNIEDVRYWIANEPEFGAQAVYLDDQDTNNPVFDSDVPGTWEYDMTDLAAEGINYIAPPMWMLVKTDAYGQLAPSAYATEAKAAGLDIITWTLERSGPLNSGGGWYHQTVTDAIDNDGDTMRMLDVLAQDVGIKGIFSDWPATVTYYANCKGL